MIRRLCLAVIACLFSPCAIPCPAAPLPQALKVKNADINRCTEKCICGCQEGKECTCILIDSEAEVLNLLTLPGLTFEAMPEKVEEWFERAVEKVANKYELYNGDFWRWQDSTRADLWWMYQAWRDKFSDANKWPLLEDVILPAHHAALAGKEQAKAHYHALSANDQGGGWWGGNTFVAWDRAYIWEYLATASDESKPELLRRQALNQLKDLVAHEAFVWGRWPSPVPREHALQGRTSP
jgi:hypothetical protein